ncbi:MAG TPA: glycosyltransferase [Terrimicrobiaceae bacterium]
MRASIIINNFNYGHFLSQAVNSALAQTYADVEVIVVDDGSTDDSLERMKPYHGRVVVIAKENGGQGSCYGAGFLRCTGDIVIFLDADDYLSPRCIERVVQVWREKVAKVHFYLDMVDAEGRLLESRMPSGRLASYDALKMMRLFGSYCSPPGSGNVFSAAFLRTVLPFRNERELVHSADAVPIFSAPYFGEVVAIREVLGFYRRHGKANSSVTTVFDRSTSLARLESEHKRDVLRDRSWRLASRRLEAPAFHLLDPSRAKRRLCYLRLNEGKGLVDGDDSVVFLIRCVNAIWHWSGYSLVQKFLATTWFILAASLPMSLAERLIRVALGVGERSHLQKKLLRRGAAAPARP